MKKITQEPRVAQKVSGDGEIEYDLWVNRKGELFIQVVGNDYSGDFSDCAFSVVDYEELRDSIAKLGTLEGRTIEDDTKIILKNTNNGGFLKAALRDLLD